MSPFFAVPMSWNDDIGERPSRCGTRRNAPCRRTDRSRVLPLDSMAFSVALDPAVERRFAGHDGALVCRQRQLDLAPGNVTFAEGGVESVVVTGNCREPLDDILFRHVHNAGRRNRSEGDRFEIAEMPVPSELRRPGNIEQCRRAQRHDLFRRRACGKSVAPGQTGIMAGGAGMRFRAGHDRIEEQHAAELGLGFGIRIVLRERDLRGALKFGFPRHAIRRAHRPTATGRRRQAPTPPRTPTMTMALCPVSIQERVGDPS